MRGKTLLRAATACLATLFLVHCEARAELSPGFSLYGSSMSYKSKTKKMSITAHYQTLAPDGSYVAGSTGKGHVTMRLTMSKGPTGEWTASGTWSMKSGGRKAFKASGSYSSAVASLGGGVMSLQGDASGMKWAFPYFDSKSKTWKMYARGTVEAGGGASPGTSDMAYLMLKFSVPYGTMDDMLVKSRKAKAGSGGISAVPAPAAVVMGLMGLGLLGWKMRRYA